MKPIRNSVDAGHNRRKFPAFLTDHRIINTVVIVRDLACRWPLYFAQALRSFGPLSLSAVLRIAAPAALREAA